uniref:Chemokine interleukin-8-like domain-containing protein n=1 Tax=Neogobius melanostomus TaxID=47308 RepID=A0A8C6UPZ4_9GOBI
FFTCSSTIHFVISILELQMNTYIVGMLQGEQALNLRCQCIENESRRVGRYLGKVEVYPPNSHCKETEIIATLKKDGQRICLDPNAQWVKRILRRNQKSKSIH